MGLDVMSRSSARAQYTMNSSPSPSARSNSLDSDRCIHDGALHKSLTPHRKHHKLLKDGSEVWSEDVEKIFVEGLKQYWESPWATYSRGRSRWRNQFLVEHLKQAGIERSKKQVASHIQVLRNMWRGEPEFHLVAGGEELFQENGLLASPKTDDSPDTHDGLLKLDPNDVSSSPSSSTAEFSVTDFASQLSSNMTFPNTSPINTINPFEHSQSMYPSASSSSLAVALGSPPPSPPYNRIRAPIKLEPLHMGTGLFNLPSSPHSNFLSAADVSPTFQPVQVHNRVLSLSLWAEGMTVFTADVDRLTTLMSGSQQSLHQPSVLLRMKMFISSIDDVHSSPNLHGFQGAISLAKRWTSEAKCITKLYCGQTCVDQEVAYLEETPPLYATSTSSHFVTAALPESRLSRCKWLDASQNIITQQIIIDGIVLAAFVYYLERTVVPRNCGPSAELVGFSRYRPSTRPRRASSQQFSPPHSPGTPQLSAFFPTYTTPIVPHNMSFPHPSGGRVDSGLSSAAAYDTDVASMFGAKPNADGIFYPQS